MKYLGKQPWRKVEQVDPLDVDASGRYIDLLHTHASFGGQQHSSNGASGTLGSR
jgi:hypothetical protein